VYHTLNDLRWTLEYATNLALVFGVSVNLDNKNHPAKGGGIIMAWKIACYVLANDLFTPSHG
jgi:hypothetical protein